MTACTVKQTQPVRVKLCDSETGDGIRDTLVMHLVDGEDEVSGGQLT